ncbi:hypothetical protein HMPREF9088_1789 [Enterococcus italicus DSM 15952]|uniref:Uncharacterized protein n=1 Tax=Enterococcus italicus (strain DSM 15952 / CCUG 50447 / LMG 22039 / TP 1.5) TaxID=888064 RepID=E6LHE9_ENTI1|nr:hypothetical protein HMPREF9088_1789 [Enterococcus italicus DSM 15952]
MALNTVSKTQMLRNNFDKGNRWYTSDFKAFSLRREGFSCFECQIEYEKNYNSPLEYLVAKFMLRTKFIKSVCLLKKFY